MSRWPSNRWALTPAAAGLGAYLAGVARHALAARWRAVRAEEPLSEDEDDNNGQAPAVSPEELLVRAQSGAEVVGSVLLMLSGPTLEPLAPELRMSGFVPVVPQERWPTDDSPAWLVSTDLQRDRLAALGLPFDPTRAGESVRAELLVRPSGQVLAVRLVQ